MRTNNLLATGGVMQEGGTKDPVSGNDVPAGALKEEVRDDVPAQLSPGEFVFPADVTRYIGLDKLMQIREAAKEGLKEMESKGQMGNAEEVANDNVGEDKFSSHIDEIMAGLEGGEEAPKKYAVGGSVNTSDYGAAPLKGFKMVQYEDVKTKAVKYIPFVNGKALLPIPTGYAEKKVDTTPTTPTTPVAPAVPVADATSASKAGGGGGSGGGGKSEKEGGPVSTEPNDAGIEGFGDIQGGTNPNLARVAGFMAGLANPIFGLVVGAAGAYATKENNKKMAAANAQAIDASALAAAGFDARDIRFAQEAAAKATLEGKTAKEIAVAAANAASTNPSKSINGEYGPKTSLDALVGITNGFNTANKAVMEMPKELADKVEPRAWNNVVKAIDEGLTPEQAATLHMTDVEGTVPAGEYNNVIGLVKEGYTVKEAIDKVTMDQVRDESKVNAEKIQAERNAEVVKQEAERKAEADRAEAEAADRAARDQERADREARQQEAAAREAANQANLNAAREAADRAEAQQAQAERDAQTKQDAAADRESQGGSRDGETRADRAAGFQQSTGFSDGSYGNSFTRAGADQGDGGG